ncbi:hypothetical protein OUZ56_000541 [Daphnia magna]|uniref:WH2 domain-containing protein n=1 Tax=Daphnia magna TaxID=35525 RepID=A0ABR0A0N4_9CRUS|nr:hypothetical protein OUZ56_000541 [Daphnia magna]
MKMVPAPPPMTSSPIMSSAHQQFQVTEDTPVDFLEGCMEILVVFPNEKSILMSIQRRMPMLDLLIHVTAANKISPAAHLLQVTDEEGRLLPHKPSTPIGSLNAHKVYILAKNRLMADRSDSRSSNAKSSSSASQFEQSFRVQVRLPRNQLFVTRVTGRTQLADLLHTVCNEKALDPRHYELRHPVNLDERLRLNSCLDDYKLQEVVLVPLGGKNATLLTPAVSVSDLSSSSNNMNRKSVNLSASNSSKMSGKSTLKPTTSESTLVGHEKKKRGLFGLLGFGKHKKGSSMGDSSISSDSVGDRSISPSRSEEPVPPPPPVEPVAPSPPSPVLFSKRLAEEAVAKRNSRLMLSQMSTEASTTPTSTNGPPPLRKTISTTSNGAVAPPANKPVAKKKRAPAPPQPPPSTQSNGTNGPPKAASEVSSCSTSSSSGSNYVSPTTSVIHHSEEEVVLRSSSPKLSYQRQDSNYMSRQRQPDSGCSSPVRSPRSNMITTPGNSSSNLTQVSSTSNASLASAIKKRKAPVPPPALHEHVEASEKIPSPPTITVVVDGSHDDSDRVSSVSDQLSSVSDLSSTRKSETPDIIEPAIVVELTTQHHHYEQQQQTSVVTPIPAARNRVSRPVKSATTPPPSPCDEGQVVDLIVKVLRDHHETNSNRKLSSSYCSSSSEGDDLTLDDQSLDMFSSRNELNQTSKAQRAVLALEVAAVNKRREQQLELRSIQGTEAERLKLAQQQQTKKLEQENLTRQNIPMLVEQPSVSPAEVERTKRKKWDRSPQSQVDLLATRADSSDDEMTLKVPISLNRRPRVPSAAAMSQASSVSEFFSLSEAESESPIPGRMHKAVREPEENEENMDDPDVSFAAMCAALARRKQRGDPELPNDLSVVSIETVQSPNQMDSSSSGSSQLGGDDSIGGGFWQRPNIEQDLDSPRSIATDSTNAISERPANSISSEDDYEQLDYRRKNSEEKEKNDTYRKAHEEEETVVSEPIYTMVIKSPKSLVAVDVELEKNNIMEQTNEHEQVDEPDRCDIKAIVMLREEEPEMERDAGDGQTESPIMWEYKLPAPPTPFQDPAQSPLDKLQIASESELSRSTRSSMSTDSLQQNKSTDEENFAKDSPRSSIDCQESEAETSAEISIKEDCDVKEVALKLHRGLELLGETTTEEPSLDDAAIEEVVNVAEENKVVLQSSDPEAKPYGIESTTDEPLSQPSSLPPVPSTLPPIDSDDDFPQPDMQFSIATYTVRVSKDSTYERKLARSGLPEEVSENITKPTDDSQKEVNSPLPIVTETKEQEMVADPVKAEENSGNSPAPAAGQLPLPMLNADFIQQFQNALHSITDPKARALQEEFLRLQQQFLTLQMQAVVQQNSAVTVESAPVESAPVNISTHHSGTTKLKEKTVVIEVPTATDLQAEPLVEADSKQNQLVESPVEPPLKITDPAQEQLPKQEIELETPVYRYSGPPQVKLDTWKPGRPRSEVIDFSRSSSFNVPLVPVETKIDVPVIGTVAATVLAMDTNTSSPTVANIPEEVVLPVQMSRIPEEESKIKPIVSEVEEILAVREKIEHIESSSNNSSNCTSPVLKPIVLRKSSFITARPFEARPVSMPIRRPNFTPMVIQPVPFVFGKIRAPEVRGFASLPPDNRVEMQGIRMTGPTGVIPFSAVNKNRSVAPVSKENPTIVIRNKLIQSARRPSAEINGMPLKSEDSPDQVEDTFAEEKESASVVVETRRATSFTRPLSMPMSSSLLLAAGAGGAVNKPQPLSPEISNQPIAAQQTVISGADPSTTAGRRSLSSKFVRKVDPREELLNSIRSFANGGSLKKTGASLNK